MFYLSNLYNTYLPSNNSGMELSDREIYKQVNIRKTDNKIEIDVI